MTGRPPKPVTPSQQFFNQLVNRSGMGFKLIPLTQNCMALVDDEDYERLSAYQWCVSGDLKYAFRNRKVSEPPGPRAILMHREVMNAPDNMEVDHKYHNGLDNRKVKLRTVSHDINLGNGRKHKDGSSKFRGVYWYKAYGKWAACLYYLGKNYFAGYFDSEEEASQAYNTLSTSLRGSV